MKRKRVIEEVCGPTPERMAKDEREVGDGVQTMRTMGELSEFQATALDEFGRCHQVFVGYLRVHPKGTLDAGSGTSAVSDEREAKATTAYREACARLKALSRQTLDAVINVAVYRRYPYRDAEKVKRGATELCQLWGIGKRRVA